MNAKQGVTLSYLTLAGARHGQPAAHTPHERARAAKAAGFRSIGVHLNDSLSHAPRVADEGVSTPELEWFELSEPTSALKLTNLALAISCWGASRVNVGVCSRDKEPLSVIAKRLAAVADVAAEHNAVVAVEPVNFGWLRHVHDVYTVMNMAGRQNVGLLLDMFHVYHDSPGWVGPALSDAVEVQLCGVPLQRSKRHAAFDASQDRPTLGESGVNVAAWLTALRRDGCTAPVSVELPNHKLAAMNVYRRAAEIGADLERL